MDVRRYVDVRESGNVLLVVDILSRPASLELSIFSIPSNFQVVRMFDHSLALCMASTVNISKLYICLCRAHLRMALLLCELAHECPGASFDRNSCCSSQ